MKSSPSGRCTYLSDGISVNAPFSIRETDESERFTHSIFSAPENARKLNAITHPAILEAGRRFAVSVRRRGVPGAAAIPLFFECGMAPGRAWPAVLCLSATRETMIRRLLGRGLTEDEALARIASQWPVSEKAALSTDVIENDGTLADLESRCLDVFVRYFGPPASNRPD